MSGTKRFKARTMGMRRKQRMRARVAMSFAGVRVGVNSEGVKCRQGMMAPK